MKERPIIFGAESARAILTGRKTMTRRPVTRWKIPGMDNGYPEGYLVVNETTHDIETKPWTAETIKLALRCPYGVLGDQLWVRETIRCRHKIFNGLSGATYLADFRAVMGLGPAGSYVNGRALCDWKWQRDVLPSIFMPRWASRINLVVTDIRIEHVQGIVLVDACDEGFPPIAPDDPTPHFDRIMQPFIWFESHWDSINAKRGYSWESNPWVWVVEFEVIEQ